MTKMALGFDQYDLLKAIEKAFTSVVGEKSMNYPKWDFIGYEERKDEEEGGLAFEVSKELYENDEVRKAIRKFFEENNKEWVPVSVCFDKYEVEYDFNHKILPSRVTKAYTLSVRYMTVRKRNELDAKRMEEYFAKYGTARE